MNKKILVCNEGDFIGWHLVKRLKDEVYWVPDVDLKMHEYVALQQIKLSRIICG